MGNAGTFPFGWVREVRGDNWQIIWNPEDNSVVARGAKLKEILKLGESGTWEEAKLLADSIINDPDKLEALG